MRKLIGMTYLVNRFQVPEARWVIRDAKVIRHTIVQKRPKNFSAKVLQYILKVYTFVENQAMKTLSLKLDDAVFEETEEVLSQLKLARNRYINEALKLYNQFNKRKVLKKKLAKESMLVGQSSAEVLAEFEKLADEI